MDKFIKVLKETVNPATQPVGVRWCRMKSCSKRRNSVCQEALLTLCQQIACSRMYGWSTYCDAQTAHCVLGAGCTGLIAAPHRVIDGEVNQGSYQLDPLAEALQAAHRAGIRYPVPFQIPDCCDLPEPFVTAEGMVEAIQLPASC